MFKSRLARGDNQAKAINLAVEQVGYHLDFDRRRASGHHATSASHFYIQTMVELDRMYTYGGVIHIMDVMKLYKECFAGEAVGRVAFMLSGFSLFLRTYPEVNRKELVEKIRRMGHNKLTQNALAWQSIQGGKTNSGVGKAVSEAMLLCYNANRQEGHRIKSRV